MRVTTLHALAVLATAGLGMLGAIAAQAQTSPTTAATAPVGLARAFTGIDAMTATVFQEGQSSFSGLGIRGRFHDARLLDNVEFLPTVEYWRNSSSVSDFRLRRSDATLGADARWMFAGEVWRPYVGAGIGIHFISNEVSGPGVGDRKDSFTKGGLAVLGGIAFGTKARFGNFIEAKGHLVGGFRQLKLNMGLSWNH